MDREEILELSRKEHQNKDFVEMDAQTQAGNMAGRVGACVCCLISVVFHRATNTFLYSPWIIYFSILGTHWLVRYQKMKQKTDLFLSALFFFTCLLALILFLMRLLEVRG